MAVIYQITNMVNGKFYIGSADSFARREWQHKYDLKRGAHKNPHLQASWNKYGADAFVFEVVEEIPFGESQLAWENKHLSLHAAKSNCYNINQNAELPRLGIVLSAEAKQNISSGRVGKHAGEAHYRFGKTVSPEVREKIGAAQRGVKKEPRVYTPDGLAKARENMLRNAVRQPQTPIEKVLTKFPKEVLEQYDFSEAVYTGALHRITGCVCPVHGEFDNYAARFRKGWGCAACGAVQRGISKSAQMKEAWSSPEERSKMLSARNKP